MRWMQGLRAAVVLTAAAIAVLAPHSLAADRVALAAATGGFIALMAVAQVLTRVLRSRGVTVFGATLIFDGLYLAYAAYATGGPGSPLRYAIVLHLIAVALLASYRTGLKMAMWHSLLLLVVFYAQDGGILEASHEAGIGIGTPFQRLLEFSAVFWIVAVATSTLAAVNERELRRRRYDLEALAAMAARLEAVSEPAEVADTLIDAIGETFDFTRAVLVGALDGAQPQLLAEHGTDAAPAHDGPLHPRSVLAVAGAERRSRLVAELDTAADPWLASLLPGARNL